jgi:hypothetical protein
MSQVVGRVWGGAQAETRRGKRRRRRFDGCILEVENLIIFKCFPPFTFLDSRKQKQYLENLIPCHDHILTFRGCLPAVDQYAGRQL